MIVREFLQDPVDSVKCFDFFNDYKDTRVWLLDNGTPDAVAVLDAGYSVWHSKHIESFLSRSAELDDG